MKLTDAQAQALLKAHAAAADALREAYNVGVMDERVRVLQLLRAQLVERRDSLAGVNKQPFLLLWHRLSAQVQELERLDAWILDA